MNMNIEREKKWENDRERENMREREHLHGTGPEQNPSKARERNI